MTEAVAIFERKKPKLRDALSVVVMRAVDDFVMAPTLNRTEQAMIDNRVRFMFGETFFNSLQEFSGNLYEKARTVLDLSEDLREGMLQLGVRSGEKQAMEIHFAEEENVVSFYTIFREANLKRFVALLNGTQVKDYDELRVSEVRFDDGSLRLKAMDNFKRMLRINRKGITVGDRGFIISFRKQTQMYVCPLMLNGSYQGIAVVGKNFMQEGREASQIGPAVRATSDADI